MQNFRQATTIILFIISITSSYKKWFMPQKKITQKKALRKSDWLIRYRSHPCMTDDTNDEWYDHKIRSSPLQLQVMSLWQPQNIAP